MSPNGLGKALRDTLSLISTRAKTEIKRWTMTRSQIVVKLDGWWIMHTDKHSRLISADKLCLSRQGLTELRFLCNLVSCEPRGLHQQRLSFQEFDIFLIITQYYLWLLNLSIPTWYSLFCLTSKFFLLNVWPWYFSKVLMLEGQEFMWTGSIFNGLKTMVGKTINY